MEETMGYTRHSIVFAKCMVEYTVNMLVFNTIKRYMFYLESIFLEAYGPDYNDRIYLEGFWPTA